MKRISHRTPPFIFLSPLHIDTDGSHFGPVASPSLYGISTALEDLPTSLGSNKLVGPLMVDCCECHIALILRQTSWNIPFKLEDNLDFIVKQLWDMTDGLFLCGTSKIFKWSVGNIPSVFVKTQISFIGCGSEQKLHFILWIDLLVNRPSFMDSVTESIKKNCHYFQ